MHSDTHPHTSRCARVYVRRAEKSETAEEPSPTERARCDLADANDQEKNSNTYTRMNSSPGHQIIKINKHD